MVWKHKPDLNILNDMMKNTLVEYLGIEIVEVGDDYIKAKMPVDNRTMQPMGLLHGGASAALSESIGSIAGVLLLENVGEQIVGVELNANHLKSVSSGNVYSITKPVRVGNRIQVWNTDVFNENNEIICTSRLTTMRIKK